MKLMINISFIKNFASIFFFFISSWLAGQENWTVNKIGTYSIPLDNDTGFQSDQIQIFFHNNKQYIALGYNKSRRINIYDFNSRQLFKVLEFDKEGPDGIGVQMGGFFIETFEKIYVISYWERRLNVINGNKKIIKKIKLPQDTQQPIIEVETLCPPLKKGTNLYFGGNLENHLFTTNHKPIVEVNVNTGGVNIVGKSPAQTYKWNYLFKHWSRLEHTLSKEKFVISFDVSDSLYVTDFKNSTDKYWAKSKYIETVPPFRKDRKIIKTLDAKEKYTYNGKGAYLGIKADIYRKRYYRIGLQTITPSQMFANEAIAPFIVVLDENFKKIGDALLPAYLVPNMCFVAEKGLYIANYQHYSNIDEDNLTFDILKISRK